MDADIPEMGVIFASRNTPLLSRSALFFEISVPHNQCGFRQEWIGMDIAEINEAIAEQANGSWIAAETPAWLRRPEVRGEEGLSFGLQSGPSAQALAGASDNGFDDLAAPPPPPQVDWRKDQGGRVTAAKDQGSCGSCMAFALCATMESAAWIKSGERLDLSEGHLFHCSEATCKSGWNFEPALDRARTTGVGLQSDLAYDPHGTCVDISPALRVTTYRMLGTHLGRKRALAQGPVLAGMAVYEDFAAYQAGVYRHVLGTEKAYHAVCIVGYDDAEGCWIGKNSWGADFGEEGFFKIAYGECEIEAFPFYAIEVARHD